MIIYFNIIYFFCYNWISCGYVQKKFKFCDLSEELTRYTCHILRKLYKSLFEHLDSIPIGEGFLWREVYISDNLFTTFVIRRDFNCKPHQDEDDYDFGFIIWLCVDNKLFFIFFRF